MQVPPGTSRLRIGSGLSGHLHPVQAAGQVCDRCLEALGGAPVDLAVLFFSGHHSEAARAITYLVRRRLSPRCLLGASGEHVIGGEVELEAAPGVSLMAISAPGLIVHRFQSDQLPTIQGGGTADELAALAAATGMVASDGSEYRGTILLADPFSVAINSALPMLSRARPGRGREHGGERAPIIGGMASAAAKAGGNVLVLDDQLLHAGAVGVTLRGPIQIDSLVSQGCRPFGPTMVVTGAKSQILQSLGGRPALRVLHEAIESLDEHSKHLLRRGVFLGRVVNEYKDRFGRGDFLIRAVVGVDQDVGALAVADMLRVGQTVRFHLRDAATADEDLGLLLDAQKLYERPAGALLFTCNARGSRLFDKPHHDAAAIVRAFAPDMAAEEKAKGGTPMGPSTTWAGAGGNGYEPLPLAGFFAAGEIGPVGDDVFLHGHTASVAFFREAVG